MLINLLKVSAIGIYLLAFASVFVEFLAPASTILVYVTLGLFAAHILEYVLVKAKLEKLELEQNHFINTFLYGVLYWLPLIKKSNT